MAAQLKQELGIDAEMIVGRAGELSVWVDGTKVAEKTYGQFPDPAAIVHAVRDATQA